MNAITTNTAQIRTIDHIISMDDPMDAYSINAEGFVRFENRNWRRGADRSTWARFDRATRQLTVHRADRGIITDAYREELYAFCGDLGVRFGEIFHGQSVTVYVPETRAAMHAAEAAEESETPTMTGTITINGGHRGLSSLVADAPATEPAEEIADTAPATNTDMEEAMNATTEAAPVITATDIMNAYHGMSDYEIDGLARSMSSSEDGTRRQAAAFAAQLEAEGWTLAFDGNCRPIITDADGDDIPDWAWCDVMGRGLDALAAAEATAFPAREWEPDRDPISAAPSWSLIGVLRDLDARDDGDMRIVDSNNEIWLPDILLDETLDGERRNFEDPEYTLDEYVLSHETISRVHPDGMVRPEFWITTLEKLMNDSTVANV